MHLDVTVMMAVDWDVKPQTKPAVVFYSRDWRLKRLLSQSRIGQPSVSLRLLLLYFIIVEVITKF